MPRIAIVLTLLFLSFLVPPAEAQQGTMTTVAGGAAASRPNGILETGSLGTFDAIAANPGSFDQYYASIPLNRVFSTGFVKNIAGTGFFGFSGDGGPATEAALAGPSGLAVDAQHNLLYIADTGNNRVRAVNLTTGTIETVFGSGACDEDNIQFVSSPIDATSAALCRPTSIVRHANGTLYVFDTVAHVIWRVSGGQASMIFNPVSPFSGAFLNGQLLTIGPNAHLAIDSFNNNLWVSDVHGGNFEGIRRIDLPGGWNVCVLGCATVLDPNAPPGPSLALNLSGRPLLTVDESTGDVYFEAIIGTHVIKRYQRSTDTITVVAGDRGIGNAPFAVPGFVLLANDVGFGRLTALAFLKADPSTNPRAGLLIGEDGFLHQTNYQIAGDIRTIYGDGRVSYCGDTGPATAACLRLPSAVLVDTDGSMVIADAGNDVIRTVDATGIISSLPSTKGAFGSMVKLAWDGSHRFVYVSSFWKNQVFLLDRQTGTFGAYAGDGCAPSSNPNPCGQALGDGGPALRATFNRPQGIAVDGGGNLFVVDEGHARIRRVDGATGTITTVVGDGIFPPGTLSDQHPNATSIALPWGVGFNPAGNLLIATATNVLSVSPSQPGLSITGAPGEVLSIVAGPAGYAASTCPATGEGGLGINATFCNAFSVAGTANTTIIGELGRVRRADKPSGIISTLAGGGTVPGDFAPSGGAVAARDATFGKRLNNDGLITHFSDPDVVFRDMPIEVSLATISDPAGDRLFVYVADTANNRIRRVDLGLAADGDVNHPPVADAGGDQTIVPPGPAPVQVVLVGSASDPDNDPLRYTWTENGQVLGHQPVLTVTLPSGLHSIMVTVEDGRGGTGTATANIAIINTLSGFTTTLSDPLFDTGHFEDTFGASHPVRLTFSGVDSPGVTSLGSRSDFAPPPPPGLQAGTPPFYYDIQTTAVLSGPVRVCIDIRGMSFARPSGIQLYQLDATWTPLANQQLTQSAELCGDTQSLGTFAIFYPEVPETVMTRVAGTGFQEDSIDGAGSDPRDDVIDGSQATNSALSRPTYLAIDRARHLLYTTDSTLTMSRIRRIDLDTGTISTVLASATLAGQSPIALDPSGNTLYYLEDVDPSDNAFSLNRLDLSTGVSTTGPGTTEVTAMLVDAQGNLFVAAGPSGVVLRIAASDGAVTQVLNETGHPVAGTLSTPWVDQPRALAFDSQGYLLVGGQRLIRVSPGADGLVNGSTDETWTWIGGLVNLEPFSSLPPFAGDGLHPTLAVLSMYQMFVAADGAVVLGDGHRVRRIDPGSDGIVNGDAEERIWSIAGYYSPFPFEGRSFATERFGDYRGVLEDPVTGGVITTDYTGHQLLTFGYAPQSSPPSIFVSKSIVTPSGQDVASSTAQNGDLVFFRLSVGNGSGLGVGPTTGPITVTDVLDPLLTFDASRSDSRCTASGQTVTCVDNSSLRPGFVTAFGVAAAIPASAAAPGQSAQISNRASVATPGDASTTDNTSQPVVVTVTGLRPDLSIDKIVLNSRVGEFARESVNAGDVVTFNLIVRNDASNSGSFGATNGPITVTDTLDPHLSFVQAGSDPGCSAAGQVVTCTTTTTVRPRLSTSFTFVTRAAAGLGETATFDNIATVSTPDDADSSNNTSNAVSVTVTGPRPPDVSVSKFFSSPRSGDFSHETANDGDLVTFRLVATNNASHSGSFGATTGPVVVTDILDSHLTFVSAGSDSRCSAAGQTVTCGVAALASQASASFDIVTRAAADLSQILVITNTATASTPNDADPSNNASNVIDVTVRSRANHPPTASAGSYAPIAATSAAGASVTLVGTGSDPDPGDTVTFLWKDGATVLGTSSTITTLLAIGAHTVTLTVTDNHGASATSSAAVSVFVGTPQVSVRLVQSGSLGGQLRFVDLEFSNRGNGPALNVTTRLVPVVFVGTGQVLVATANPVSAGNLAPAQSRVVRVVLNVPPTVRRFLLIEAGSFTNLVGAARLFAGVQTIVP